jgi:formate/nitrite transporter FocA (FNT family)
VTDQRRVQLGDTDAPAEDEVALAFDRVVSQGAQRLHRTWREVLTTGLAGGLEVGVGVLALVAVYAETGSHLLAGLAFSVGFVALLLAARLWSGTLVANLVGGWLFMWLVAHGFPQLAPTMVESARHFVESPLDLRAVCLAFLGGTVITLMTRMQNGTTADGVKIVAAVAGAFVLAGLQLFHSILDSLLVFGAIHTGTAPFGYGEWLAWFWYVTLLNMAGGLLVVTLLRLVRSKELIQRERAAAAAEA